MACTPDMSLLPPYGCILLRRLCSRSWCFCIDSNPQPQRSPTPTSFALIFWRGRGKQSITTLGNNGAVVRVLTLNTIFYAPSATCPHVSIGQSNAIGDIRFMLDDGQPILLFCSAGLEPIPRQGEVADCLPLINDYHNRRVGRQPTHKHLSVVGQAVLDWTTGAKPVTPAICWPSQSYTEKINSRGADDWGSANHWQSSVASALKE